MSKNDVLANIRKTAKGVIPKDAVAMLYGSRARGDAHESSDWDILILLDKDYISLQDIDDVAYPLREMGWMIHEDINPVLYTKNEWSNYRHTPFYEEVQRDAILL